MRRPANPLVVPEPAQSPSEEPIEERVLRITNDVNDLTQFYNIEISPKRSEQLRVFYHSELAALRQAPFDSYNQEERVDYILLQNFLKKNLEQVDAEASQNGELEPLLPFAPAIIKLCEERQEMIPINAQKAADELHLLEKRLVEVHARIESRELTTDKLTALRAAKALKQLWHHLKEWFRFFNGYDPLFSWWVKVPFEKVGAQFPALEATIRQKLVGIAPGDEDAIVGQPVGRSRLLADLSAEKIGYTPEEIIRIGEIEYAWCLAEMIEASQNLGYGRDWKAALEHVKNTYVDPSKQPQLIRDLALEAEAYVEKADMVTVPSVAKLWRMFMIPPSQQKVSPFFLGGTSILVSYPTDAMDHSDKLMSMRGNNPHFSRSTVFHELIPGHHLQYHMMKRFRPYRLPFHTPFWTEGWAFYWELILWDRNFAESPEDKIGMLFWHMHRCARIIFSFKFHLGLMTPQECIDLLVDKVGHERANAEGEVRRSFNGDYPPLYQAAYMLGALQFYQLRREIVDSGRMGQKEFHDRILRENNIPVELLRALLTGRRLKKDFQPMWRFYEKLDEKSI